MAIISDSSIRHNGKVFPAGTLITDADMDQKSQKLLVEAGEAEFATLIKGSDDDAGGAGGRLTVEQIAQRVADMTDIAELEAMLKGEKRKGATEAITARIEELKENA